MSASALRVPPTSIASLLRLRPGHMRSIRMDHDLADPGSSRSFVATPFAEAALRRLLSGLEARATDRAWRLTGDYGTGKSSLVLALCRLSAGRADELPVSLRSLAPALGLSPLVVVGDREPIGRSILRAIHALRRDIGAPRLEEPGGHRPTAEDVFEALDILATFIRKRGLSDGLLLVLDELGKNLEYAASHPDADDIFLLQGLAERAARSGDKPFMLVAILHQAVAGYAAGLSTIARREWEKVAGRLSEIVFAPPIEQMSLLVSSALDVDVAALPRAHRDQARQSMALAVRLGWYGPVLEPGALEDLAPGLFPISPLVLPVLARILRRFGQNERSLFGFLSSAEPGGMLDFANQPLEPARLYGLAELYDYVRMTLANQFGAGTAAGRWAVVDAVVNSGVARTGVELDILKIVGILNLLDDPMLSAVRDVVMLELEGSGGDSPVESAIERLERDERVLYRRGVAAGLYLWPNSSVDLDEAFAAGIAAVADTKSLSVLISLLPAEHLVARRHYAETGALRHFQRFYATLEGLPAALQASAQPRSPGPDGRVVVAVVENERERKAALRAAREAAAGLPATTLVAIAPPVGTLMPLLRDIEIWAWVRDNVGGLSGDKVARDEVARQLASAGDSLSRALQGLIEGPATIWIHGASEPPIRSARDLYAYLSRICDDAFDLSPIVRNELINRSTLSSAAARARYMLVEALATNPHEPGLGISEGGVPPERAIYLSMLERGRVHVRRGDAWAVTIPPEGAGDPLRLSPSLNRIGDLLRAAGDGRVRYEAIVEALRGDRLGVRDGLIPLLIAIYLAAHWHHTAVYEDGTYLDQVGGPEFNRMVKEPEHFELQHCAIEGVRAEVFAELAGAIGVTGKRDKLDLLDVVRPMSKFIARLPDQARRTRKLSVGAVAMREALVSARDPKVLVFQDLPAACGLAPISTTKQMPAAEIASFVASVKSAMRELREAYPDLIKRLFEALALSLEASEREHGPLRAELVARANAMLPSVTEAELRTFLLRLADSALEERAWIESLASALVRKPPERWTDLDEAEFHHRLPQLARRFRRVEAAAFDDAGSGEALRLVVTSSDGREVEDVLRPGAVATKELASAERDMRALLERHGRAGILAAARLILDSGRTGSD
jgi:hypothetical protein